MRKVYIILVLLMVGLRTLPAAGQELGHRAGGGLQYDLFSGDADDTFGVYAFYEHDLPKPMALLLEVDHVDADFSVPAGSGSFTSTGLGGALVMKIDRGELTPYVGVGGAYHLNSFDGVDYDNKLSIILLGGARMALEGRYSADFSLRYRVLRPNSRDPNIAEINLDAWILRAGITFEL